jgi:hypothetical protein
MFKKTITFIDFEENERTEDFYFHLSKAEIIELELSHEGGLSKTIERIRAEQDAKRLIAIFKDLILLSYGVKSPNGRQFVKNQETRDAFMQTEAYSMLFMELAFDAKAAADFLNGIIPYVPDPVPATTPAIASISVKN